MPYTKESTNDSVVASMIKAKIRYKNQQPYNKGINTKLFHTPRKTGLSTEMTY